MNIYYKGYVLDCLTGNRLGGPTMAVCTLDRLTIGSCPVREAGIPSGPNLALKAWRIAGELIFSPCWKVKEAGSQRQWRIVAVTEATT